MLPEARAIPARARLVAERLAVAIPEPDVELDFEDPWQLVIATILSAQATDKVINEVTPALFERYPTPAALAEADREAVEALVKRTGFFRNKAKAVQAASRQIVERFGGEVPRTMEELVTLPGVARKTANVVLGQAFGVAAGIAVDTHVGRVARRLGLTEAEDPEQVEAALQALLPEREWTAGGMRLLLHGRYVCVAKAPKCRACPLSELCPAREAEAEGGWEARAAEEAKLVAAGFAATRRRPSKGPRC